MRIESRGRRLAIASPLLALAMLAAGCAVGRVGFIAARVTPVTGGWVMESYTIGAHVRTEPGDLGLGLGSARRVHVFAETAAPMPSRGWHAFITPPTQDSVLRYVGTLGLDVRLADPDPGVTFGWRQLLSSVAPPEDAETFLALRFMPAKLAETCISIQPEISC
jgi:hypothetical protein